MATQTLNDVRILWKNDTAANWLSENPVLMKGEAGWETDTGLFKVGDGINEWADLEYAVAPARQMDGTPDENDWNYPVGTIIIDNSTGDTFILIDNTEGDAVWEQLVLLSQLNEMLSNLGAGDMLASVYATNGTAGRVDWARDATQLRTAIDVTLSGDVGGTVNTNLSGNVGITTTLETVLPGGATSGLHLTTIDEKGRTTAVAPVTATQIPDLTLAKITDAATYLEFLVNKGVAGGYAALDQNGQIPLDQINDAILGGLVYGGEFDADTAIATLSTNAQIKLGTTDPTITLTDDTEPMTGYLANEGIYYIVANAGTFGGVAFVPGDWLVANASGWAKIHNTDAVFSVNGQTGTVVLLTTHVAEGTNLYYTDARATTNFGTNFALAASTGLSDSAQLLRTGDTLVLNGGNAVID